MITSTVISLIFYITAALGTSDVENRDNSLSNQVVTLHNQYRAQYGAPAVTWNQSLYSSTLAYAQNCRFQHSNSNGKYGENLYASSPSGDISNALASWMNEAQNYNYNNPGFSEGTGHFTQVVWKSTKQVVCAIADCPAGSIFSSTSKFVVCRYTPPGNVQGQFPQNVGKHI